MTTRKSQEEEKQRKSGKQKQSLVCCLNALGT